MFINELVLAVLGVLDLVIELQNWKKTVGQFNTRWVTSSLVPRPRPAFRRLQYGKAGEGLVSFLT